MSRRVTFIMMLVCFVALAAVPGLAQQGYLTNTTVTLYYYDNATASKGAIVPMPDNPQYVNSDPATAAPGMYAFAHVPSGSWYYLEADHEGNKWYTLFYMEDNVGTKTANVHIPPMMPVNATAAISPSPVPAITPTPTPTILPAPSMNGSPRASPGSSFPVAILTLILAGMAYCLKRK